MHQTIETIEGEQCKVKLCFRPTVKIIRVKQPVIFDEQVWLVFVCLQQY